MKLLLREPEEDRARVQGRFAMGRLSLQEEIEKAISCRTGGEGTVRWASPKLIAQSFHHRKEVGTQIYEGRRSHNMWKDGTVDR